MVYAHISHGLLDSPAGEGPVAVGRPAPGRQEVGDIGRRAFVADEVADEAARKPASKPSPCPRASARSVLIGRRLGYVPLGEF